MLICIKAAGERSKVSEREREREKESLWLVGSKYNWSVRVNYRLELNEEKWTERLFVSPFRPATEGKDELSHVNESSVAKEVTSILFSSRGNEATHSPRAQLQVSSHSLCTSDTVTLHSIVGHPMAPFNGPMVSLSVCSLLLNLPDSIHYIALMSSVISPIHPMATCLFTCTS